MANLSERQVRIQIFLSQISNQTCAGAWHPIHSPFSTTYLTISSRGLTIFLALEFQVRYVLLTSHQVHFHYHDIFQKNGSIPDHSETFLNKLIQRNWSEGD